jgi:hypothetical protein
VAVEGAVQLQVAEFLFAGAGLGAGFRDFQLILLDHELEVGEQLGARD